MLARTKNMTRLMQIQFDEGELTMNIKPIKSQQDYQNALSEIERLFDTKPNTPDGDRLEILTTLVEKYEEDHYPIEAPNPVEALKYFMESRGMERKDLEKYIGKPNRISEILNYRRSLSLTMIRRLHFELGMPAEALLKEIDPKNAQV